MARSAAALATALSACGSGEEEPVAGASAFEVVARDDEAPAEVPIEGATPAEERSSSRRRGSRWTGWRRPETGPVARSSPRSRSPATLPSCRCAGSDLGREGRRPARRAGVPCSGEHELAHDAGAGQVGRRAAVLVSARRPRAGRAPRPRRQLRPVERRLVVRRSPGARAGAELPARSGLPSASSRNRRRRTPSRSTAKCSPRASTIRREPATRCGATGSRCSRRSSRMSSAVCPRGSAPSPSRARPAGGAPPRLRGLHVAGGRALGGAPGNAPQ